MQGTRVVTPPRHRGAHDGQLLVNQHATSGKADSQQVGHLPDRGQFRPLGEARFAFLLVDGGGGLLAGEREIENVGERRRVGEIGGRDEPLGGPDREEPGGIEHHGVSSVTHRARECAHALRRFHVLGRERREGAVDAQDDPGGHAPFRVAEPLAQQLRVLGGVVGVQGEFAANPRQGEQVLAQPHLGYRIEQTGQLGGRRQPPPPRRPPGQQRVRRQPVA